MARRPRITGNKRQRERDKQRKRQEKALRKQERKEHKDDDGPGWVERDETGEIIEERAEDVPEEGEGEDTPEPPVA